MSDPADGYVFGFQGIRLAALPSGALWLEDERLLCVSDLHFGKSDRIVRRIGLMLPPYEIRATLDRLAGDIARHDPAIVICLGDSFDDLDAANALQSEDRARLDSLQAGRRWIWIAGNHDPAPLELGGSHLAEYRATGLTFRHEAAPGAVAEVSGHYHPKLALPGARQSRPCFLFDDKRLILPAYGTYTGGLSAMTPALRDLFSDRAFAVLTGARSILAPLPRRG